MTLRPELFRAKATECQVAARKTKDLAVRQSYMDLMRGWRELAEQIDHFEQTWLDREGF